MDITSAVGNTIQTIKGVLEIVKFLGKGKSGYSYLSKDSMGNSYVLKLMHYQEVSCYSFDDANKVDLETNAFNVLKEQGIEIPELIESRPDQQYLLEEYIDGDLASHLIADDSLPFDAMKQLVAMSKKMEKARINMDYFPNNFLWSQGKLVYVDYEINEYKEEWNLQNWGIWYWANSEGMKKFLGSGEASDINRDCEKGIPHKEGFEEKVAAWFDAY